MATQEPSPFPNWETSTETRPPDAFERTMLAQDKIYVVLAVVLIIWFGIASLILRTDSRLKKLERRLGDEG